MLIQKALDDTSILLCKLKFEVNSDLLISSIRRRLKEEHIQKWLAAERPRLTEVHALKGYNFAKEYRHLLVDDWRKYIWSDECSVKKSVDPRQM
jgi:hypothetical protein